MDAVKATAAGPSSKRRKKSSGIPAEVEREKRAGRAAFDFGPIRKELGL